MNAVEAYRVRMVEHVLNASAGFYPPHFPAPVVVAIASAPALPALDRRTLRRFVLTPATGEARPAGVNEATAIIDGWGLPPACRSLAFAALTSTGWEGTPDA